MKFGSVTGWACWCSIMFSMTSWAPCRAQDLDPVFDQRSLINDVAASHPASAYIDQSTVAVAEIDWRTLDVDAMFAWARDLTGREDARPSEGPDEAAMVKQLIKPLHTFDAGKIYLVVSMQTFSSGIPLVVVPVADADSLLAALRPMLGKNVIVAPGGKAVLIGEPNQINGFQNFATVVRDELLQPLADAKRMSQTVVIALPELTRSLLAGIWPTELPAGWPWQMPPRELVKSVQRIRVTFNTPPDPSMKLSVELSDVKSAEKLMLGIKVMLEQEFGMLSGVDLERAGDRLMLSAKPEAWTGVRQMVVSARLQAEDRTVSMKLRELGLAFYRYSDREKHLPPRCFVDPDGNPLHSWLVALLPDIQQQALYSRIQLDRGWDQAGNELLKHTLLSGIGGAGLPDGHTRLRGPVYPGSIWQGDGPPKTWQDIRDPRAETILLIEAPKEASVHWADPTPWLISEPSVEQDVFGDREQAWALMSDGSAKRLIRDELGAVKLRAMLTIDGDD